MKDLEDLKKNQYTLWHMEVGWPGGYGRVLLDTLQQTVQDHPSPGISHYLHLCLVRRGKIELWKSDHTTFAPGGSPIDVKMPPVASSWAEFNTICNDLGVEATQAVC